MIIKIDYLIQFIVQRQEQNEHKVNKKYFYKETNIYFIMLQIIYISAVYN